jgi:hypothetical protein
MVDGGWLGPTGLLDRRVLPARLRAVCAAARALRRIDADRDDAARRPYTGVAMQVALTRPERDAYERPTAKV